MFEFEEIPTMLSYRHAFHAGNHADVLKHIALIESVRYLALKDKGFQYVDTHAGAGSYALREGYAAQNEEWSDGIERLRGSDAVGGAARKAMSKGEEPAAVGRYLDLVASYGRDHGGDYPGSPAIVASLLRPQDRAVLFELHPSDHELLSRLLGGDTRVLVRKSDGFSGLRSVLPPPSRRGLVLVDPSYELASDYEGVVAAVDEALKRFSTGVYAIWYPLLERAEAKALPGRLLALGDGPRLRAELRVRSSLPGERGMAGSGLVVMNPPWPLAAALAESLPYLAEALRQGEGSGWSCESS